MAGANLQMQSTRQQILEYLQRHGRGTVKELGALLGLTSTGIRQHLTVLERDGLVEAHEERGRVGRPTLVYSLTAKRRRALPEDVRPAGQRPPRRDPLDRGQREAPPDAAAGRPPPRRAVPRARRGQGPRRARQGGGGGPGRAGLHGRLAQDDGGDTSSTSTAAPSRRSPSATAPSAPCTSSSSRILTGGDTRLTRSLMRGERACTYRVRPGAVRDEDRRPRRRS